MGISPLWPCTSSRTSRAEHCSGTAIILWGFHVTELALWIETTMGTFSEYWFKRWKFIILVHFSTDLSTPSSFHLCILDMMRLPPHAPWVEREREMVRWPNYRTLWSVRLSLNMKSPITLQEPYVITYSSYSRSESADSFLQILTTRLYFIFCGKGAPKPHPHSSTFRKHKNST